MVVAALVFAAGCIDTTQPDEPGPVGQAHSDLAARMVLVDVATSFPTGHITLRVERPGFQRLVRSGVELTAADTLTVDLRLQLGNVQETVEVTGAMPTLDTESAAIGTDITNQYVRDIPLYNRSFFGLAFLAGGVTETSGAGVNDNYPAGTGLVSGATFGRIAGRNAAKLAQA